MQRWKAITAVLEKPPECDCGSPVAGDWAYCARCGRELRRRRVMSRTALLSTLAVGSAILAFVCGLLLGGRPAASTATARAGNESAELRAKLTETEATARRLKDRNEALWRQLTDRNDSLRKQLLGRQEALRAQLNRRDESVEKQLKEQDASIGVLANRAVAAEQLEEENTALRESVREAEEQLKAWLEMQEAGNQTPALPASPVGAGPGAAGDPTGGPGEAERQRAVQTQEGIEEYWAQFDAEHPTVNGREIWEESMRAAIEEIGPDDANLREHATRLFEERLARAEETARGTPAR